MQKGSPLFLQDRSSISNIKMLWQDSRHDRKLLISQKTSVKLRAFYFLFLIYLLPLEYLIILRQPYK